MAYATRKPNDNPLLYLAKTTRCNRWVSPRFWRGRGAGGGRQNRCEGWGRAGKKLLADSAAGKHGAGPPSFPEPGTSLELSLRGAKCVGVSETSLRAATPRRPRPPAPTHAQHSSRFPGAFRAEGGRRTRNHRRCHRSADPRAEQRRAVVPRHPHIPHPPSLEPSCPTPGTSAGLLPQSPTLAKQPNVPNSSGFGMPLLGGFQRGRHPNGKVWGSTALPQRGMNISQIKSHSCPSTVPVLERCSCQTYPEKCGVTSTFCEKTRVIILFICFCSS